MRAEGRGGEGRKGGWSDINKKIAGLGGSLSMADLGAAKVFHSFIIFFSFSLLSACTCSRHWGWEDDLVLDFMELTV